MCRWLAYSGSPILMKEVLYAGHKLVGRPEPAFAARRRADQRRRVRRRLVRRPPTPGRLPQHRAGLERPATCDELAGHISSPLFFTHIRAAIGSAVQQTNCHPFRHDHWLFMHNGYINEFATIKRDLVLAVDPSLYPEIQGQADTEVLFYLALTLGLQDDPPTAVGQAIGLVEAVADRHGVPHPFQGTVATTDGESIWAFRYSSERNSRSLFYTTDVPTLRELYPERKELHAILRRRAADRLRTARRRRRRLERGTRIHLRPHRPRPRRVPTVPTQGAGKRRPRRSVRNRRRLRRPGAGPQGRNRRSRVAAAACGS